MTDEMIFEQATSNKGGRFNGDRIHLEEHILRAKDLLEWYKTDKKLLKPFPPIIYDFVDNNKFNAMAMKYEGKYIIAIHESVRLMLFDLFNRMLSHKEILVEVGDVSEEVEYNNRISDYYTDLNSMVEKGHNKNYVFRYPVNRIRRLYAHHLTTLAMDFIFEHEL